ncbi:hypothetical protein ACX1C1_25445 [Paenibacillus sp. strain BS8-2]
MELWTGLGMVLSALVVFWLMRLTNEIQRLIDGLACAALVVFGTIAGAAVARTLANDTVFMTEVHSVLLNWAFLIAGAYLGIYGAARLAYLVWPRR